MWSGQTLDPLADPYGWLGGPEDDDDDREFSVMDLMRAGGMSLEESYHALYEEDLTTFCSKLGERVPYVTSGYEKVGKLEAHGCVDVSLVERDHDLVVPLDLDKVNVGVGEVVPSAPSASDVMEQDGLDEFHARVDACATRPTEHVVIAIACDDGSLRHGPDMGPIEKVPSLDTAIVSVRGKWDARHSGVITFLSGIVRGITLRYTTLCDEAGYHESCSPGEEVSHGCCRNWAELFGRLGQSRVVPWFEGGVVCMFFGGGIPYTMINVEPDRPCNRQGALWPLAGHNSDGISPTTIPDAMVYGVHSLLTGPPVSLSCTEAVVADNLALIFKDPDEDLAYVLTRRYLLGPKEGDFAGVLKERGGWRWYVWSNTNVSDGVFLASLELLGENDCQSVNGIMNTSDDDGEACGFCVSATYLDCLSSDVTPLSYRQASIYAGNQPVMWAGITGNHFLCDLFPCTGRSVQDVVPPPVVTLGGELVMETRRAACAVSQLPFGVVAHCSPMWSGKFCVILAKQWALLRRLWASRLKLPDSLLGRREIRDIAVKDMWRWGNMELIAHNRVTRPLFSKWVFSEQLQGNMDWIPPPALAVLEPCGSDTVHWDPLSLLSPSYCNGGLFDVEFMRAVGSDAGSFMPEKWLRRYSAALKYGSTEAISMMVKVWGRVPTPLPAPAGEEDVPGFGRITATWQSTSRIEGWPCYGELYGDEIEQSAHPYIIPPVEIPEGCECVVYDNRTFMDEERGHVKGTDSDRRNPISF